MQIKKYLVAGLLVWVPLVITFWALITVINFMDLSLSFLPQAYQPRQLIGFNIPGLGVLLSLATFYLTGLLITNYFGRRLIQLSEKLLNRIPVVSSIYSGVKQVMDSLFSPGGQAFSKAVLVEYPRSGLWTLAFLTGTPNTSVTQNLPQDEVLSVFIPTTPNPTSGFLIMVARKDIKEVAMSVDEALKYVLSLGVAGSPADKAKKLSSRP